MNAQEMFENLGYTKVRDGLKNNVSNWDIIYETNRKYGRYIKVTFYPKNSIYVSLFDNVTGEIAGACIDLELHQAITQQMKELGWIELD